MSLWVETGVALIPFSRSTRKHYPYSMGLLGTIAKAAISANQKLRFADGDAQELQAEQLRSLLQNAADTAFGKYYGFAEILQSENMVEAYRKAVPIHSYEQMNFWWEQQQKLPDITWPGKPKYFALTSGTTGKSSKRIPITSGLSDSMRNVGTSMAGSLPNYDFPEEVFESSVLMLGSSADLKRHENGHLEGEISGINVHNFPDWYEFFYHPGKDIAAIDDWDQRVVRIAEEAPDWNVGAAAGIPSWILLMLQEIIKRNKLEYIQDIWPNFQIFVSGGVAFEAYRKDFEKISNRPLTIMDTYLASEGFFAYTLRPDTMAMKLALSHGYYYEFVPFDKRGVNGRGEFLAQPVVHQISEVEKEQEYVLVISTCAGAWRYAIGDTIKFTNTDPHEIVITGRTKFFLNVVGSQLSEEKLDEAVLDCAGHFDLSINEYMVAAVKNEEDEYVHQWVLVANDQLDEEKSAEYLDQSLKERNNNYAVARNKALKGIRVKVISKERYNKYLEKTKKKGGQVKTPKVMREGQMKELLEFLE